MAGKPKGPVWFKLWTHQKPMMDVLPDEVLGRAIKAAMHYFVSGEVPALGQLELVAFSSIKSSMDEAFADYERDVENGKKGGRPKRNGNKKPPVMEADLPHPPRTEAEADAEADADAEAEAEAEAETDKEGGMADKPPAPARFSPPGVEEVRQYCQERNYCVDPERFVNYYESIGWMVGKNRMKNWKAALRNWNRKEKELGTSSKNNGNGPGRGNPEKAGPEQIWPAIGIVL